MSVELIVDVLSLKTEISKTEFDTETSLIVSQRSSLTELNSKGDLHQLTEGHYETATVGMSVSVTVVEGLYVFTLENQGVLKFLDFG